MANQVKKSEHNGAKNGGGEWCKRVDAKKQSNRVRRETDKEEAKEVIEMKNLCAEIHICTGLVEDEEEAKEVAYGLLRDNLTEHIEVAEVFETNEDVYSQGELDLDDSEQ